MNLFGVLDNSTISESSQQILRLSIYSQFSPVFLHSIYLPIVSDAFFCAASSFSSFTENLVSRKNANSSYFHVWKFFVYAMKFLQGFVFNNCFKELQTPLQNVSNHCCCLYKHLTLKTCFQSILPERQKHSVENVKKIFFSPQWFLIQKPL